MLGQLKHRISVCARVRLWLACALCLGCGLMHARPLPEDLDGKPVDPVARASGKVVVLVFVRSDCPISNRYAPVVQALSVKYAERAVFWLVYPDKTETPAAIRKHLASYGYHLAALRDANHELVRRGQAQVTPEAAVFDPDGRLTYHGRIDDLYAGFGRARKAPTTHELEDGIQAALAHQAAAVPHLEGVGCYISEAQ